MENNDRLRVGVITSPHGVKGEVNVFPTTDDPDRFKKLKRIYIDTKKNVIECEIEDVKYFKKMVILKFRGHDDRNEIEKYRQCDLMIDRCDAIPLEEGQYFICDLIGFRCVEEDGRLIGILKDIMSTGANDVYVVEKEDKSEILVPGIKDCIINTDMSEGKIVMHLLPGL